MIVPEFPRASQYKKKAKYEIYGYKIQAGQNVKKKAPTEPLGSCALLPAHDVRGYSIGDLGTATTVTVRRFRSDYTGLVV